MTVTIKREQRTYEPDGRNSFLRDTIRAGILHDDDAKARLAAHQHECEVDAKDAPEAKAPADLSFERRVNPSVTAGMGGEFAPPIWYPSMYASAQRAESPLGDLIPGHPLPRNVQQINVPRVNNGSVVDNDVDGSAVADQDITTANTNSQVVMLSGAQVISQQLLDLTPGGFDALIWPELEKAYLAEREAQLINGTGGATQLFGVNSVNILAANNVSGSTATTVTILWPLLGQAAANVGNNRFLPPEVWLMSPRRWFWIASSLDQSQRPIASPGNVPDRTGDGMAGGALPMGPIVGLPVYMDGALNGATASVPDTAFCLRPSEMFLFEGTPTVQATPEPTSSTLQVRLTYRNYAAAVVNRYKDGIGKVTAMPQPSGF